MLRWFASRNAERVGRINCQCCDQSAMLHVHSFSQVETRNNRLELCGTTTNLQRSLEHIAPTWKSIQAIRQVICGCHPCTSLPAKHNIHQQSGVFCSIRSKRFQPDKKRPFVRRGFAQTASNSTLSVAYTGKKSTYLTHFRNRIFLSNGKKNTDARQPFGSACH